MQPEGYAAEDVYVCESRYAARNKSFKKIKIWALPVSTVKSVPRDVPLPVVRVASMFAKPDPDKLMSYTGGGGFIDKVRSHCVFYKVIRVLTPSFWFIYVLVGLVLLNKT